MIIKVDNIVLGTSHNEDELRQKIAKKIRRNDFEYKVFKKSIDSRKKKDIKIIYSALVKLDGVVKGYDEYRAKSYKIGSYEGKSRPVIVGFGPAGMFAGLVLAKAGARPIILERGQKVEDRMKTVEDFFTTGKLDTNSNIQFGEGGAGTFSDGKISTGVKDKFGRKDFIVDTFIRCGADESIKYINKAHIGTDYLVRIVKNIREEIISLGGEVRFNALVDEIKMEDGKVSGIYIGDEFIPADKVIFATGHSSRDTFEMLHKNGINMETKPFAVGVRCEHRQDDINMAQYGTTDINEHLLTSDYKLTYRTKAGRAVYSFCMCPGGYVVNSSSEEGMLCVNGMSDFARDSENANSAIVASVSVDDWADKYGSDVLSGMRFQRDLERATFALAGGDYSIPVQLFADFKSGKVSKGYANIKPVHKGYDKFCDLNEILPSYIADSIKEAMPNFARKIRGFDDDGVILSGVETRTSSPIRINRNEHMLSNVDGLYFAGEGAGYAGGIMSAALDGMKIAETLLK